MITTKLIGLILRTACMPPLRFAASIFSKYSCSNISSLPPSGVIPRGLTSANRAATASGSYMEKKDCLSADDQNTLVINDYPDIVAHGCVVEEIDRQTVRVVVGGLISEHAQGLLGLDCMKMSIRLALDTQSGAAVKAYLSP